MATYEIEQKTQSVTSAKQNELILLRTHNSIFHISNQKVATQWSKLSNNYMKKTSYFIDDKRAIEYEAAKTKFKQEWEYHAQLLHPGFKTQSTFIESTGYGCEKLEHYQQRTHDKIVNIWWLPEKKLVKRIQSDFDNKSVNWQLKKITYKDQVIKKQLGTLLSFQSTDFTDIGDNESDPFFRKMIHLGFIEHSASGFYDSEGNSLSSSHQH